MHLGIASHGRHRRARVFAPARGSPESSLHDETFFLAGGFA
jgi:hypothetical protein